MADDALRVEVEKFLSSYRDGILPIVTAGHPVLREVTVPYTDQLGDLLPDLLECMRRTMLHAPGVGLAAPQIGIGLAIAVIHDPGSTLDDPRERPPLGHRTLINPQYTAAVAPGADELELRAFFEGCLSVPGYQAVVARHRAVHLIAEDENGAPIDEIVVGWPARIVQHETDHLNGRLYIDHAELRTFSTSE